MHSTITWIIGPQLIGIILIIMGLIQKIWPPKHINGIYGYRMPSSKQNQQTWDEANRYSAIYMIKAGIFVLILGLGSRLLLNSISISGPVKGGIWFFLILASSIGSAVSLILVTERHMRKTFDQKQL